MVSYIHTQKANKNRQLTCRLVRASGDFLVSSWLSRLFLLDHKPWNQNNSKRRSVDYRHCNSFWHGLLHRDWMSSVCGGCSVMNTVLFPCAVFTITFILSTVHLFFSTLFTLYLFTFKPLWIKWNPGEWWCVCSLIIYTCFILCNLLNTGHVKIM